MILVDTSVWVNYFNGISNRETDLLDNKLSDDFIILGDLILLELLQGFRNDNDYKQALSILDLLDKKDLLNSSTVIAYADMYRSLRKRGITIRKTTDTIIAGFCILNNIQLLQSDRGFLPFKKYFGLKLI